MDHASAKCTGCDGHECNSSCQYPGARRMTNDHSVRSPSTDGKSALRRTLAEPLGLEAMREALKHVREIIKDGALVGFNCHDGDWAQRLFASQAVTFASLQLPEAEIQREEEWTDPPALKLEPEPTWREARVLSNSIDASRDLWLGDPDGVDGRVLTKREVQVVISALRRIMPPIKPGPSEANSTAAPTWKNLQALWLALDGGPQPRCRDCADHDGTCPNDRDLPCDPQERALEQVKRLRSAAPSSQPVVGVDQK